MDNKNIKNVDHLLNQFRSGSTSEKEEAALKAFIYHHNMEGETGLSDEDFLNSKQMMWAGIAKSMNATRKRTILWPRIVATAAALAAVTLATWLYFMPHHPAATGKLLSYTNDIAPGSLGATLTLASGRTIKLSGATHGELAKEAGVKITKTENGQLVYEIASSSGSPRNEGVGSSSPGTAASLGDATTNTLFTAKGETYQLRLPDGTRVWLNAASTLSYMPSLKQNGQRRVHLEGEAYFQVSKDKTHPFVVESRGQEVKVLGTHFNINSYRDEKNTKTTLAEGSVQITSLFASKGAAEGRITLKPGQQATNDGKQLRILTIDTDDAVAWINGYFIFNEEPLEDIMRQISRWYNMDVEFKNKQVRQDIFGGSVRRSDNLSQVLRTLSKAGRVRFSIEGRKIIVDR